MKTLILLATLFIFSFSRIGFAQLQYSTKLGKVSKIATVKVEDEKKDYMPGVIHVSNNANQSAEINPSNSATKLSKSFKQTKDIEKPMLIGGFEGVYDGTSVPNDDAIAVSNEGIIVVARNSRIAFYDRNFDILDFKTLASFTSPLGIVGSKYDPRLMYDTEENRFILVLLSGFDYETSQIIIAVSSTNNPMDDWHFYSIPGNFLEDNTWSDYPVIAVNQNELFVQVTNFANMDGFDTWDYYGSRIIQMDKFQLYNGAESIEYAYHTINPGFAVDTPSTIYYYNVSPVKAGKDLYGPNMYFLSSLDCPSPDTLNDVFPPNDTIFLVEFTNTYNHPDFEIKSTLLTSPIEYAIAGPTPQPEGHFLQTGYNTIKDSFFAHDFIQFTMNSKDFNTENVGVFHGIIRDVGNTNQLSAQMISSDTLGLAYGSLVYVGEDVSDMSSFIGMNYVSENLYPGNLCIRYENGEYSEYQILKQGESVMDMTDSEAERWGDFTTMQLRPDNPEVAYFIGSFGRTNRTKSYASVIATKPQAVVEQQIVKNFELYPNPATDFVKIEFELSQNQVCCFKLYDSVGKLIDEIYTHRVKAGKNLFSFNTSSLDIGIYHLIIEGDAGFSVSEKLVIN
jgi:hypothetical protein